MSLIQSFPSEILGEIFAAAGLDEFDVNSASHVSRWWRKAALAASELWLNIQIRDYDSKHTAVVLDRFRRSSCRPISLKLQFTSRESPTTPRENARVPRGHSPAQSSALPFFDCGGNPAELGCDFSHIWPGTYPLLRTLDLMLVHFYTRENPQPDPAEEITFPLPENHALEELALYTINVGNVVLPQMRVLRLGGLLAQLVGPNGRINRWILDGPQRLELHRLPIPRMHLQTEEAPRASTSSVVYLKLSGIYASISAHGTQNDCAPFFDALQTPLIHTLELEHFYGRVWDDFLFALSTPKPKYPLLTTLRLKEFKFRKLSYASVGFFLCCFPGLESLVLTGCPSSTWESVWHVLTLQSVIVSKRVCDRGQWGSLEQGGTSSLRMRMFTRGPERPAGPPLSADVDHIQLADSNELV
ncbi:hypothetical protein B0H11DRAFT_1900433 [Mycena galericulata]|nr:hypothetical protein B0H11DRAFT_1900433 [Mycena galericulata]